MMAKRTTKTRGVYEQNGVWHVLYYVDGRRHRERVGASKSEAVALYQLRKTQARQGSLPQRRPDIRFDDFATTYLEGERGRLRAFREYERHVKVWRERFAGRALRSILPLEIEQHAAKRIDAGASATTVGHELGVLRRIFNVALANDLVDRNPVKKVRGYRRPSGRVRFLTDDEEARLRQEVGECWWPLVAFALNTGLRQGEQLDLRWRHVDLANRVLTVPRSKNGGMRHVQLNEGALVILRALPRRLHCDLVFSTSHGTSINPANLSHRVFRPAVERTGITDLRWHDLRHTFASRLVMAGVDLRSVQELLGHKTLAMTVRYSHLAPAHLHSAVRALDSRGEQPSKQPSAREGR